MLTKNSRKSSLFILLVGIAAVFALTRFFTRPAAGQAGPSFPSRTVPAAPAGAPTDQIIVGYAPQTGLQADRAPDAPERMQQLSAAAGLSLAYVRAMSGEGHVLRLPEALPLDEVQAIADRLEALPAVAYADPDARMFPARIPNDTWYDEQWHYSGAYGINAPAAWDITTGSPSIRIAVLDTGITNHADLAGRWVGGYDFIANLNVANDGNGRDSDPHDPGDWVFTGDCTFYTPNKPSSWHGTHVAGTIGARSNNGLGVAGINWVSPIVPVRVLGKCGGYTSDIIDGMRWAAGLPVAGVPANPHPARVLNLSLGGLSPCGSNLQSAINAVNAQGAVVVVSAGNSNQNAEAYSPANCAGVITVAATASNGHKANYSNYGSTVEISAPGGQFGVGQGGVLSTLNSGLYGPEGDDYAFYQGTSMAAPHVSGVVSLMLSLDPTLNYAGVLAILQATARPFPPGGTDDACTTAICGAGIVNAAAALALVDPPPLPGPYRHYLPSLIR